MEKHELSKTDFDLIDAELRALLNSRPEPAVAQKVADLRSMFRDAYTGWLEIEEEAGGGRSRKPSRYVSPCFKICWRLYLDGSEQFKPTDERQHQVKLAGFQARKGKAGTLCGCAHEHAFGAEQLFLGGLAAATVN